MSLSYVQSSSSATFTDTVSISAYTTGWSTPNSDDLIIYFIGIKDSNGAPTVTPSGGVASEVNFLASVKSAAGVNPGVDVGDTWMFAFSRIYNTLGSASFDLTGSNVAWCTATNLRASPAGIITPTAYVGSDNVSGSHTNYSAPFTTNPVIYAGDTLSFGSCRPTDTAVTHSSPAFTRGGYAGTALSAPVTAVSALGQDIRALMVTQTGGSVTTPGLGASSFDLTASSGVANYGPTILVTAHEGPLPSSSFAAFGIPL